MDIEHKGRRDDSMRKRYFDRLKGIDPTLKKIMFQSASTGVICVSKWLEQKRYMLYDGNDYGRTGLGLAVFERV